MNRNLQAFPTLRLLLVSLVLLVPATTHADVITAWIQRYNGPGNNTDSPKSVIVDSSNNVVVTGYSLGNGSGFDFATIKYSSAGVPLWTNRYNGPSNGSDYANAVAVDASNNVIVTGYSQSDTTNDYATVKYSSDGVPLWTNRYNGSGGTDDQAYALAVDGSNNVIVTGMSGGDYVTIQYSSAGGGLWTNRYGGPANGYDKPAAVAVDASNNVIVTGQSVGSSSLDYLTIKYSSAGVPLWTNRYDGPSSSIDYAIAAKVDGNSDVIITGVSVGSRGYYDFTTIKYSSAGVPVWTNRYNDLAGTSCYAQAIAVDRNNNVIVTGDSYVGGQEDYAIIKYASGGAPLWTNRFNSGSTDIPRAVVVDDSDNITVAGYCNGNAVTVRYSGAGVPVWTNQCSACAPWGMALDHNADVIVTAQANDAAGGFNYATYKLLSSPMLTGTPMPDGSFQVCLRPPNKVVLEASTNLASWSSVWTNSSSTNLLLYTDPGAGSRARRFYRAVRML